MARTLQDEEERRQRQFNADAEHIQKKEYDGVISELYVRANEGDLTVPQLNQLARTHRLTREDQAALRGEIERDRADKERPSTPEVFDAVAADVYRSARRRPRPSSIACTRRTAPAARA